jgi:hypothetical protein
MFDPHSLSHTSPPDQPFDLETIEAMSRGSSGLLETGPGRPR